MKKMKLNKISRNLTISRTERKDYDKQVKITVIVNIIVIVISLGFENKESKRN